MTRRGSETDMPSCPSTPPHSTAQQDGQGSGRSPYFDKLAPAMTMPLTPVTAISRTGVSDIPQHRIRDEYDEASGSDSALLVGSPGRPIRRKKAVPDSIEPMEHDGKGRKATGVKLPIRRSKRLEAAALQLEVPSPLPSILEDSKSVVETLATSVTAIPKSKRKRKRTAGQPAGDPLVPNPANQVDQNGDLVKITLVQERVRHDPWKLLVVTTLLNKTSGRAARPVFLEILDKWPTARHLAEASIPDLTEVLYPLGLFNQRAASLVRLSQQYLTWGWPIISPTSHQFPYAAFPQDQRDLYLGLKYPLPLPSSTVQSNLTATGTGQPASPPETLDVKAFYGAGIYASDSFRIFSDLLPGKGAPEREGYWVQKRRRAIERWSAVDCDRPDLGFEAKEPGLCHRCDEISPYYSDEDESEVEEWRTVMPTDKELRRYLIWRWGLEGIEYDVHTGPNIVSERDKRRLHYLHQGK